jgi:hypothetical protein
VARAIEASVFIETVMIGTGTGATILGALGIDKEANR